MERKYLVCFMSLFLFSQDANFANIPINPDNVHLQTDDYPVTPPNTASSDLSDLPSTTAFSNISDLPSTSASSNISDLPSTSASSNISDLPSTTASSNISVPPLTTASSKISVLNTISDLRDVEFGHRFPQHGLSLLYYIANLLVIQHNDNIWAVFLPTRNDFGFHYYSNTDNIFPPLTDPSSEAYYSVGNISPGNPRSVSLPPHVTAAYYQTYNPDRKKDRIVIQFNLITHQIKAIYITQHRYSDNLYDFTQTHRISVNLMREIQNLSTNEPESLNVFLNRAGYVWPSYRSNHYCLIHEMGRFVSEYDSLSKAEDGARQKQCSDMKLQVRTTQNGNARITWENIPSNLLNVSAKVQLYKDCILESIFINGVSNDAYSTTHLLTPGLQVRLVSRDDDVIRLSPKLDEAYWNLPTKFENYVLGSEASVQLYVKDGLACARLYFRTNFAHWQDKFGSSWVGFYPSDKSASDQYSVFQWAVKFNLRSFNLHFNVYEYQSKMPISPGAQVRFFPTKEYNYVTATVPWESENF